MEFVPNGFPFTTERREREVFLRLELKATGFFEFHEAIDHDEGRIY